MDIKVLDITVLDIKVLDITVLDIKVLDIKVLDITVLDIKVLDIKVLNINSSSLSQTPHRTSRSPFTLNRHVASVRRAEQIKSIGPAVNTAAENNVRFTRGDDHEETGAVPVVVRYHGAELTLCATASELAASCSSLRSQLCSFRPDSYSHSFTVPSWQKDWMLCGDLRWLTRIFSSRSAVMRYLSSGDML
ncbi:hypothetical protein EYF80_041390 [Liparis tanakae]|uniref:Uncharacterized protein n=1 Tax=Liparis tanakae TaxID=230148 RepID=A0A4Z2G6I9_9TELE|nr:hypothetical protein EYF80_041390 [Liparis tanakae]